ncbi:hypothetical protein KC19_10G024500 [Ceratodon purpureus]|uniref:Uncharacterized protein n=1 Tax=Ceratodon purpureus TaxID=3225 RepID=A0A8T0GH94_CERPU|nr:hypothetical protein KC19_10G024500 [Ceratodon purpureus]
MATSKSSSSASKTTNEPINNDLAAAKLTYLSEVESATNEFVEESCDLNDFKENLNKAEEKFMGSMDKVEYGAGKSRQDEKAKAKFVENLTIQIDDQILESRDYSVDFRSSGIKIKVKSPPGSP